MNWRGGIAVQSFLDPSFWEGKEEGGVRCIKRFLMMDSGTMPPRTPPLSVRPRRPIPAVKTVFQSGSDFYQRRRSRTDGVTDGHAELDGYLCGQRFIGGLGTKCHLFPRHPQKDAAQWPPKLPQVQRPKGSFQGPQVASWSGCLREKVAV